MEWIQQNIINILIAAFIFWMFWKRFIAPKLSGVKSMSAADYMAFRVQDHSLIDVRTSGEWQSGHPAEAVHIELAEVSKRMHELSSDRPVVVICASGNRSVMAASKLAQAGFENVYNFSGGMGSWKHAGLAVKTGE